MKKITCVLLALCIALPLFAGDVDEATFTVSGNATLTWGMDLESTATGFANSTAADFVLNFKVPTTAVNSGSEAGAVYGEIAFKDIKAEIEENDIVDAGIALNYAKIMGDGFWISLVGPDNSMDFEDSLRDEHLGIATSYGGGLNQLNYAQSSSGGFEGAYTIDGVGTFGASVFSLNDWTDTSTEKNAYGVTVEASISAVENLTFMAGAGFAFGTAATSAFNDATTAGAKVAYKIALGETMSIEPNIGFDLLLDGSDTSWAIGNGLQIGLGGSKIANSDSTIHYRTAPGDDALTEVAFQDDTADGIGVSWSYYQAAGTGVDAVLDLYAEAGVTLIPDAQIALGFAMDDVLGKVPDMGFGAYVGYTIDNIYVDLGFVMKVDNEATTVDGVSGDQDGLTVLNAGFSITDLVPMVDLDIDWWSGNLATDTGETTDPGLVKVAVKIAY